MPVAIYMDAHIPRAITEQLRLRGIEVLAATEEGTNRLPDDQLLETASALRHVVFTHDIRFRALAERWQREGHQFAGLAYGHAEGASIGQYVRDLELIAKASDPGEWQNTVLYLPL
jgi:predicted nuclease of predicted toxin-antitoxin system